MPEIVISDITLMWPGYCIIGLEPDDQGSFRSVRPMPWRRYAWLDPFTFNRGDWVRCPLAPASPRAPHFEDRQSGRLQQTGRALNEVDLIRRLETAEVASSLEGLFGCPVESDKPKGNFWIDPSKGSRAICGCPYNNIRFRVFQDPKGVRLRAELVLPSDERLWTLPVVDREWNRFLMQVVKHFAEDQITFGSRTVRFLNDQVSRKLRQSPNRFARIGLARAKEGKCWLMLDSLFPQPTADWLDANKPPQSKSSYGWKGPVKETGGP
ncbi:MAG: hypothetical protein ACRD3T_04695 [Terriglobia bacterium]